MTTGPHYGDIHLESIELVVIHKFQTGQVFEVPDRIVGDEYYYVVTGIPNSGCCDVETVGVRVDSGSAEDTWKIFILH